MLWWDPQDLLRAESRPRALLAVAAWLGVCTLSIATGLLTASWNGINLSLGPLAVDLTFYPPLALCLLLTLLAGPFWGIVPAYATSFSIALSQGMPVPTSAAFALATPITLTVLWICMVKLQVSPSLRSWRDALNFVTLSLVATGASSVGALVWISHHGLRFSKAHGLWEGWVVGDFLQIILIVGPLLYCFHRPVQQWVIGRLGVTPRHTLGTTLFIAVFFLVFAVMIIVGVAAASLLLASLKAAYSEGSAGYEAARAILGDSAFFLSVYATVFLTSIIVFSYTLGREIEGQLRDFRERERVHAEREKLVAELEAALSRVKQLSGLLPICASCKKIRDDKGYWKQIEVYIRDHSEAEFSHGLCPQCCEKLYPGLSTSREGPSREEPG